MKRVNIRPNDLAKYMGDEKYFEFIKALKKKYKLSIDFPIFITMEWDEI